MQGIITDELAATQKYLKNLFADIFQITSIISFQNFIVVLVKTWVRNITFYVR